MLDKIDKKIISVVPFALLTLTVALLSSQPPMYDFNAIFTGFDKIIHFVVYFTYGISIQILSFSNFEKLSFRNNLLLSFFIGISIAISDEIYQSLQPCRFSSVWDFFADMAGILISLFPAKKIYIFLKLSSKK